MSNCCIHGTFLSKSLKGHSYKGRSSSLQHYMVSMCIVMGRGSLSVLMTRVVAVYPTFVLMQSQSGAEPYSSHGRKEVQTEYPPEE